MKSFESTALIALIASAAACFAAYLITAKVIPNAAWLDKIGQRLYQQKIAQLSKPPLIYYQNALDRDDLATGFMIIVLGILLKSIVSFAIGILAIFLLPIGVATIPTLVRQFGDGPQLHHWASAVTALQTSSHLLAACIGFSATWLWIRDGSSPLKSIAEAPQFSFVILLASVVVGIVAAWVETDGHFRRGFLP